MVTKQTQHQMLRHQDGEQCHKHWLWAPSSVPRNRHFCRKLQRWHHLYASHFMRQGMGNFFFFFLINSFDCPGSQLWHVGSSIPNQGLNPGPPALGAQSLNHWTTREIPELLFLNFLFSIFFSQESCHLILAASWQPEFLSTAQMSLQTHTAKQLLSW